MVSVRSLMEKVHNHPNYKPLGEKKSVFHMFECVRFHSHQAGLRDRRDKGRMRDELVRATWLR